MCRRPEAGDTIIDDRWTAVTRDRSLSAHFEHTVALTEDGVQVLTSGAGDGPPEEMTR